MSAPQPVSDAKGVAQMRAEALSIIERAKGVDRLREVLQQAGDPRLLDAPSLEDDLHRDGLLAWAIAKGAVDYARVLIESGADPMDAGVNDFRPTHALGLFSYDMSEAAINSFVEMLEAAGAKFDIKDAKGYAPLHYAVAAGSATLAQTLIDRGVPIDAKLLDDAAFEATITPGQGSGLRPRVIAALRLVRSIALGRGLLSAMPDGEDEAKPSGVTSSSGFRL